MANRSLSGRPAGEAEEQSGSGLSTPIQFIKGVGPRRAALFSRLGVKTISDALYFFPRRYEDRRSIKKIADIVVGRRETVLGKVRPGRIRYTPHRRKRMYEIELTDETGSLTGIWFNFREPYMKRRFTEGSRFIFHGEVRWDGQRLVIYHPEVEEAGEGAGKSLHFGRIVPVYPLTEELGQRQVRKIFHQIVRDYTHLAQDRLPSYLKDKFHLPAIRESLRNIHFPDSAADVGELNEKKSRWHKRIIFEEFFFLELWLMSIRAEREKIRRKLMLEDKSGLLDRFIEDLSFRLTADQKKAFEEIKRDMLSSYPMYRLLQGDVGCGKTVVTAMAVLLAADNGLQSAVMAPTEILARQHYLTLSRLFRGLPVNVTLLVSGMPSKEKKKAREDMAAGSALVVAGTHALIQEGVDFGRLGLVVIDEQHRFGVGHRLSLKEKGDNPDMLVVTATPIPRTMAMTLYGDMDISVITEMPPGRQPVETKVIGEEERDLLYGMVRGELESGHQAFIIYPLVEESERLELRAAEKMASHLAEAVFADYRVGMIHGRLKPEEKKEIMDDFRDGKIHVLVSTTVVEVGVDIPGATVIVIEHAERFGLAQLHQLRGRVGRGGQRAVCLLVASEGANDEAGRRLEIMTRTSDGFRLAEEDLKERGPGEMAGLRQSGAPDFLLANIITHRKALEFARQEAMAVMGGGIIGKYELTKLLDSVRITWSERARYLNSG